ncbi:hypothetical protein COT42_06455 [Candidatus Saganbacteria bacterium CG08_land_8_20_14_0_20_45_16]|uniref:PpiC domain-containing protein n=1 Tax=Candidatus Saganbacteria bacterium CG08_land_8_20_14_0_20_45_16 TaxID=2014293 RepID=A0A2H0XVY1_UNCSA|nr:MAG: hypothetical protein COT42_06455 [Candidatus Saganbacteria bacterium CG08_land_8_20_14_0_20_45_16]
MLRFLRKKMKGIMITVAIVFAASMFYGLAATKWQSGEKPSTDLAKVNGQSLNPYRYREILGRLMQQFGAKLQAQDMAFVQNLALNQTIDFTLLLNQAKKKVKVTNREVDLAVEQIMKQEEIKSQQELRSALERAGLPMGTFRDMIKDEMLVQKMVMKVREGVTVSPNDLREVKASHLLVSDEAVAKSLLAKVKAGEDFAALARKYSEDPGSAKKGGDLGYFSYGQMVEPFAQAAFALKIGEISGVIKTNFGFHIIKATDSRLRKFEGKEKNVEKAALMEKQQQAFQKWFSQIKEKAKIEVNDPLLKGHAYRFKNQLLEAIAEYKKAAIKEPNNALVHFFLADSYKVIGKPDLAVEEYEVAIRTDGGNPSFYLIFASYYESMGQKDKAIEQYKRASLVAGDNKAVHEELLARFRKLKATKESLQEQAEIARINKKEKFEKELKGE